MNYMLGRLEPSPERQMANDQFLIRNLRLGVPAPGTVEIIFKYPASYIKPYDQGNIGSCTGYSASWLSSINNGPLYNAYWLYKEGQRTDGDPNTSGDNDGGYVWAVLDVLRKSGHRKMENGVTLPVNILEGIQSYYWAKASTLADDIRTAAWEQKVGVFGIPWYAEFNSPQLFNGEYWIGRSASWGRVLGGHAICYIGVSDRRGAALLRNSWGSGYPDVWISFKSIERLLRENGELAIALDYNPIPSSISPSPSSSSSPSPSPSASPSPVDPKKIPVKMTIGTKRYTGTVYEIK